MKQKTRLRLYWAALWITVFIFVVNTINAFWIITIYAPTETASYLTGLVMFHATYLVSLATVITLAYDRIKGLSD